MFCERKLQQTQKMYNNIYLEINRLLRTNTFNKKICWD